MNEKKIEEKKDKNENGIKNIDEILSKEISHVKTELSNKLKEYNTIKENLSKLNEKLNETLSEYKSKKNSVKEKEQEIDSILLKISKHKKNLLISINKSLNSKFYNNLSSISGDWEKEKSFLKFFSFVLNLYNFSNNADFKGINLDNNENENMNNVLKILKNESEIRGLIFYSYEIIQNLNKEENDIYNKIKEIFLNLLNELNNEQKQYPMDILYEYIKNIFIIIDFNNEIKNAKKILSNLTSEKNNKFIESKKLQNQIQENTTNKKIIKKYIMTLNSFITRIKEHDQKKSDIINKELISDIEKYKELMIKNRNNLNNNFDIATALTLKSNFSLSNKSLIKENLVEKKKIGESPGKTINEYDKDNNNEIQNKKSIIVKSKNYLIMNKNRKNIKNNYQKLHLSTNPDKKDKKNQKKILYMKQGKNSNEKINHKALNKIVSLTSNNIHNLTTNDIKQKTIQKKQFIEKSFNKTNKNKFINKNLKNRNQKSLITKLQSQKVTKTKINKTKIKSLKENKHFHTLNNIIFNNDTKEYYINQNNKNKNNNIIQNKKELKINILKNKEKILTLSEKKDIDEQKNNNHFHYNQKLNKSENNIIKKDNNSIKNKEHLNTEEISKNFIEIQNNESNNNKESNYLNEKKDSICDEMPTKNLDNRDTLIKTNNKNYINKLGKKQNIIWSENLYNNKVMQYQNKNKNKNFNVEKPIDAFACCTSCT